MTSGHPRINCCVPGCKAGTTRFPPLGEGFVSLETGGEEEWICSRHWVRVPTYLKRRRTRLTTAWRAIRRKTGTAAFWELKPGSPERLRMVQLEKLIRSTWATCRRKAAAWDVEPAEGEGIETELKRLGL